jgi:hypothetical protein
MLFLEALLDALRKFMRGLVALLGAALLTGCGIAVSAPPAAPEPAVAAPAGVQVPDPATLDVPSIGIRTSLDPSGRNANGGWEIPPLDQPMQATWYQPGPEPGEPGPAVLLGHINGNHQQGVFARLHELAPGDRITVTDVAGGKHEFEVVTVRAIPKDEFDPEMVLSPVGLPELFLITCGGELERTSSGGRYLDNTVVEAKPV